LFVLRSFSAAAVILRVRAWRGRSILMIWSENLVREKAIEERKRPLRMPERLSPSAVTAFSECEQWFLYRYIWKLPEPPSPELERGILVHKVLEEIYSKDKKDRTIETAHSMFRSYWTEERQTKRELLFDMDLQKEREWGLNGLRMLDNYFILENPQNMDDDTIFARERWVRCNKVNLPASLPSPLTVLGKIDRLDTTDQGTLCVVDYKTGSAPTQTKYSKPFIEKMQNQAFFQLFFYAWLLEQEHFSVSQLKIIYLGGQQGGFIDQRVSLSDDLKNVEDTLLQTWTKIFHLISANQPLAFKGCTRSFCNCRLYKSLIFSPSELKQEHHEE